MVTSRKPNKRAEPAGGEDVTERIRAALASAMADGALRPGTKLSEDVIGKHFKVSRTVVRGALNVLQRDHLIDRQRNRGAFVAEPTVAEARELLDARNLLELSIVERAAQHAQTADLDRLEALTHEEEAIHNATDEAAKTRLSGHFHVELAALARNGVLQELLEKVVARIALVSALYGEDRSNKCGAHDHRAIVAAMRRGDVAAARAEMQAHLDDIAQRIRLNGAQSDNRSLESVLERFSPR
ncbi:MAG: GntR family transcriptional regulator [Moraxellaceae bacterium]|nr:GntR family transcriptional regulator [Moraxellaceae bacterium]